MEAARARRAFVVVALLAMALELLVIVRVDPAHTFLMPAIDLHSAVWGPVRGLLAGWNPYDAASGYQAAVGVGAAASLHGPWVLVAVGPLALLPIGSAHVVWTAVGLVATWTAAAVVMPPRDGRSSAAACTLGLTLTFAGTADEAFRLGQLTPLVVLGLALLLRWPHRWAGVLGVALMTVTPQFALPFSILAAGLGWGRTALRGWVVAVAASLPVLAWAAWNEGDLGRFVSTVLDNLRWASGSVNSLNRIDLIGLAGLGLGAQAVGLACVVLLAVVVRRRRLPASPPVIAGGVAAVLMLTYAMPYMLPLALLAVWPLLWERDRGPGWWPAAALVLLALTQSVTVLRWLADSTGLSAVDLFSLWGLAESAVLVWLAIACAVQSRARIPVAEPEAAPVG